MQAWGAPSAVDVHAVSMIPTKRGVIGMIGCCMGIERGDPKLLQLSSAIEFDVSTITDENEDICARRIKDFQTVRPLDKNDRFSKAKREKALEKENAFVKTKYYVCDGSYRVTLTADEQTADEIFKALKDPVWIPYLGRKCCFPSEPIVPVWM